VIYTGTKGEGSAVWRQKGHDTVFSKIRWTLGAFGDKTFNIDIGSFEETPPVLTNANLFGVMSYASITKIRLSAEDSRQGGQPIAMSWPPYRE